MSGWANDPILLDSDVESISNADSSDLSDAEFEIVKQRFCALSNKYATLWKSMLPDKENDPVNKSTPQPSPTKPLQEAACPEVGCSCRPTKDFLPASLFQGQPEHIGSNTPHDKEIHDDSNGEAWIKNSIEELNTHGNFIVRDNLIREEQVEKEERLVDGVCVDSDNEKTSADIHPVDWRRPAFHTDEHEKNSSNEEQSNRRILDRKRGHPLEQASKESYKDYNKSYSDTVASQSDEENDDDDGGYDEEDTSAVSTVIQWDSWSLPKHNENEKSPGQRLDHNNPKHSPKQLRAFPTNIIVPSKTNDMDDEKRAHPQMSDSVNETEYIYPGDETNAESIDSVDTEPWDDEENNRYNSESEAEWSGNLEKAESGIEDLIEQTKSIEILDSSDDEMIVRPQRRKASREFKRAREDMAKEMFKAFDKAFCAGRLEDTTTVTWSKKLNTTAGMTRMKQARRSGMRFAEIELAVKVLDDEERLRDTLVHEMCHAAAFIVDGVSKPPHGDCFKKWANRAMDSIPGVIVTTKHDYEIKYSHFWTCSDCGLIYKRHSKSIDVKRHRCGRCKGNLFNSTENGIPKKARAASKYQIFISEKSAAVRASLKRHNCNVTQAAVLQECARLWQEQKGSEIG